MPKPIPVQSDYTACVPKLTATADGKFYNLQVEYTGGSSGFQRLKKELLRANTDYGSRRQITVDRHYDDLPPQNGNPRLKVTFVKNGAPFLSSEMTAFANSLSGHGCITDDASRYIRQVADGTIPLYPSGSPVSSPSPTPATTIAAPVAPAVATAPPVAPTTPAPFYYKSCRAQQVGNRLILNYEIDGHAASFSTQAEFQKIRSAFLQATQQIPPRSDGSIIRVLPKSPTVISALKPMSSNVEVSAFRAAGSATLQLRDQEKQEIAAMLESEQLLTPQDAQNFRTQFNIGVGVGQTP